MRNILRRVFRRKDNRILAFQQDLKLFKQLNDGRFSDNEMNLMPFLDDKTAVTHFDAHYIYHPAWAARILSQTHPELHIDISSILHFCTTISAFIPTRFYDYRPASLNLSNLTSDHADLTDLPFENNSISSLSCMHTLEHIGLGRYGDPINPQGDLLAISELMRVCAVNGNLLVVVPVGEKKIMFNAHRIYDPEEFLSYFTGFHLIDFSLITDQGEFINSADFNLAAKQHYGCGCYWLRKAQQ